MNVKTIIIFVILSFFTVSWALNPVDIPRLGTVSETTVEVFIQPDSTSEKIARIDKNDKVIVVDETGGWCQVIIADSICTEGWILKKFLFEQKLEGKFMGANLEAIKAFLKKFFGDDITFSVGLYKYGAIHYPINSLVVQSISIHDRSFFIMDYPFPELHKGEEYTFSYSPILLLEWKEKKLIPRNFHKHVGYTGIVDYYRYFDSQGAKFVKRHFMVAEIFQHFFEDYEEAIEKYQEFTELFRDSIYESGLLGDGCYKGNAGATAWRWMAHLYCKLNNPEKAIECLYHIIRLYPNEKIFGNEWWGFVDLKAAAGILKIRGLSFPNSWITIWDEFPCTLKDNEILEECERIIATSNSDWVKNLGVLGIIQYHLSNLEFPIDIYMKLVKDYADLCIRNAMEGDYYPILLALNFMCEFLEQNQRYDQAALLIYKSVQALPMNVFVPSMYNGEPKISCADYLCKSIEKRLERIKKHMKYVLARITEARVHLRRQPDLQGKSIGLLDKNEKVVVLESSDNWRHILRYNGEDGWVHDKFIRVNE